VTPLANSERATIKTRLLPVIRGPTPQVRAQLLHTLQKILQEDFPSRWPEFLQATVALLSAGDAASVSVGVQCMLGIARTYRFKSADKREDFDHIVQQTFPQLLNIANSLVNETSLDAGEILRTILKTYKHTIFVSSKVLHMRSGQEVANTLCSLNYHFIYEVTKSCQDGAHYS